MARVARIIRKENFQHMKAEDDARRARELQAIDVVDDARKKAEETAHDILEKAKEDARLEAAKVLGAANAKAQAQLASLEQDVSQLVAQTVEKIIGDLDQTEAIKAATKSALASLSEQTEIRLRAAPGVASAVEAAVSELESNGVEIVQTVQSDESLTGDRVIASSSKGHTEIGLSGQTEAATAPWRVAP